MPAKDTADIDLIRKRFAGCVEAESAWRQNALLELKFKAGTNGKKSYQWDEVAQTERIQDQRPFFTINRTQAFIKQITNQQRLANLGIDVIPVDEDADEETAKVFRGVIRNIQNTSDSDIAIDVAFDGIATHGKGAVRVMPEYLNEETGEQVLTIVGFPNIFSLYIDPAATKPDRSDMRYAFVTEVLPREEYEALYGEDHVISATDLASIGDSQKLLWFPNGAVRLIEYYELIVKKSNKGRLTPDHVRWRKMNALETLEETTFPITRIPIVMGFGDEFDLDGEVDYQGMVRNAKDPAIIVNKTFTSMVEMLDSAPLSPYLVEAGQVEGFEAIWKQLNRKKFPFLPWKGTNADGQETKYGPPQRTNVQSPIEGTVVALNVAQEQFKAVMQLYDASLGQNKRDQSGVAIAQQREQGEIGNSNYIDNLKRLLRSLGRLLVEMIPKYYDTARILRIIGKDEKPQRILVHAGADNAPKEQLEQLKQEKGIAQVYDLGVGRFDVVVTAGPTFLNQQQEQLTHLLDLLKVFPQAAPVMADLVAKKMGASDIEERLKKMLPKELQDENDEGPSQQELQMQLAQMGQQHDLLIKELEAKTQEIETQKAKVQGDLLQQLIDNASKEKIAALNNDTKLAVEELKAGAASAQASMALLEARITHMLDSAQMGLDAAASREHEVGMAGASAEQQAALQQQSLEAQAAQAAQAGTGAEA